MSQLLLVLAFTAPGAAVNEPAIQAITAKHKKPAERIAALKKWLDERIADPKPVAGLGGSDIGTPVLDAP
jgi:hypothetical protein